MVAKVAFKYALTQIIAIDNGLISQVYGEWTLHNTHKSTACFGDSGTTPSAAKGTIRSQITPTAFW